MNGQGLAGHEQKKFRLDRLDHWKSTVRLDELSYSVERENIETWARIFGNNLNAKVEIILRNHAQQIERTLALFRERAIPGHPPVRWWLRRVSRPPSKPTAGAKTNFKNALPGLK